MTTHPEARPDIYTSAGRHGNVPADCHEKIRQLVDYWQKIHPAAGLPGRQHIDPVDIPHLLANLRLQDIVSDPPRIRMRLMGTRILDFFGQEYTGKWFDEVFDDFENSRTFRDMQDVVQTKLPNWRRGRAGLVYEKDFVMLERVHLPLARDGETVDMVVTCMVFGDSEGRFV